MGFTAHGLDNNNMPLTPSYTLPQATATESDEVSDEQAHGMDASSIRKKPINCLIENYPQIFHA